MKHSINREQDQLDGEQRTRQIRWWDGHSFCPRSARRRQQDSAHGVVTGHMGVSRWHAGVRGGECCWGGALELLVYTVPERWRMMSAVYVLRRPGCWASHSTGATQPQGYDPRGSRQSLRVSTAVLERAAPGSNSSCQRETKALCFHPHDQSQPPVPASCSTPRCWPGTWCFKAKTHLDSYVHINDFGWRKEGTSNHTHFTILACRRHKWDGRHQPQRRRSSALWGHSPDGGQRGVLQHIGAVQEQEDASNHDLTSRKKNHLLMNSTSRIFKIRPFGLHASCLKSNNCFLMERCCPPRSSCLIFFPKVNCVPLVCDFHLFNIVNLIVGILTHLA